MKQGYIFSMYLFSLYRKRITALEERIKIQFQNAINLRYADYTMLLAERRGEGREKIKLIAKVKIEMEKSGLM